MSAAPRARPWPRAGPLTPDQIVYCKSFPLWFEPASDATPAALVAAASPGDPGAHQRRPAAAPHVILVKGLGLFAAGDDFAAADTVRLVYTDAIKVMAGARRLGGIRYMADGMRKFIEDWEVESYRKTISAAGRAAGRAAGKVAIVTGAAQGFGLEISQDLDRAGRHRRADRHQRPGRAGGRRRRSTPSLASRRAIGLPINVTDGASVERGDPPGRPQLRRLRCVRSPTPAC